MDSVIPLTPLAEIAGVFVGFGALIALTRRDDWDLIEFGVVRASVTAGMTAMVAALIPLGVASFGVTGRALWVASSVGFLGFETLGLIDTWRRPDNRAFLLAGAREHPAAFWGFWLLLELPMVAPLVLIVLGAFPGYERGLYTASVLFCLFQCVWQLWQVMYSLGHAPTGGGKSTESG